MTKTPISIITSTFNSEKTIVKTLNSIINQNLRPIQYIVIDGQSKDCTVDILRDYATVFADNQIEFEWISEPDSGIYDAWNKGLELVKGQWVTFLGSDDYYTSSSVLSKMNDFLILNSKYDWVYSKVILVDNKEECVRKFNERWLWGKFKKHMYVPHAGSFHNMEYFKAHGNFDINFKIAGDYEMLLRKKSQLRTKFLDLFTVNMLNEGVSNKNIKIAFKEETLAKRKHKIGSKITLWLDENQAYLKYLVRNIIK